MSAFHISSKERNASMVGTASLSEDPSRISTVSISPTRRRTRQRPIWMSLSSAMRQPTEYEESNRVASAFTPHFTVLSKLPNKLAPNAVQQAIEDGSRAELSGLATRGRPSFRPAGLLGLRKVNPKGLFQDVEYVPSSFTLADDLEKHENWKSRAGVLAGPFLSGGSSYRGKHERLILGSSGGGYPTLAVGDPYNAADVEKARQMRIAESRVLYGAFKPSGGKALSRPSRCLLPEIVMALHKRLAKDWPAVSFSIIATEDDFIIVRLEEAGVGGAERAFLAYMNSLARSPNDLCQSYGLNIIIGEWNRREDGYIYYCLRPAWVPPNHSAARADSVRLGSGSTRSTGGTLATSSVMSAALSAVTPW